MPCSSWQRLVPALFAVVVAGCTTHADVSPPGEPPAPAVTVAEARRMDVPLIATPNGTTRALREVSVRARVRGVLQEQHFEEGADVKEGELLFVIEEAPYKAKLEAARGKLAEAQAALERAQASKSREIAQARLDVDQAVLSLAQVEERRQTAAFQRNAASPQDVDRARAQREKAEAEVASDKAALAQAQADFEVDIAAARAKITTAKAAVDDATIELSYCRIFATISGRIGEAMVQVGNLVGPTTGIDYTELTTIQQLDPMGVDLNPSSRYLERATELIRSGLAVNIERPGLEGQAVHPYEGKAFFIDNRIDPTTSTFLVKASVPNPQKTLLPGEYVLVTMTVGLIKGAVVVPEQAVFETQGGSAVYVVGNGNTVEVARIRGETTYRGLRVVESGLDPDNRVIVEGLQIARPGMKVKPVASAATKPAPPAAKSAGPATRSNATKKG